MAGGDSLLTHFDSDVVGLHHVGEGNYDLYLGNGWTAEFTRDAHGFKFWTLRHGSDRMTGDGGKGERVPPSVAAALTDMIGTSR